MKHVLIVVGIITGLMALAVYLFWYYLAPHKHPTLCRAERGDVQSMYLVGVANLTIKGDDITCDPNIATAIIWLRKASEAGHAGAMWTITGLGIPNEEKVMWLKKGAEMGNKACMVELMNGYLHQLHGLPKDLGAFLYWEARVSEATMKENGESPERIAIRLKEGEARRRREMNYDGPIRPSMIPVKTM